MKYLSFFVLAIMLVTNIMAQENPNPRILTPEQMESAIPVVDTSNLKNTAPVSLFYKDGQPKSKMGKVYKHPECDESNPESVCYFGIVIEFSNSQLNNSNLSGTYNQSKTVSCILPWYNSLGVEVGRLQQNVGVTLHHNGSRIRLPATAQLSNANGTYMTINYWDSITGPTVSPGLGVRVNRYSGVSLTSTTTGILKYQVTGWTEIHSVNLVIHDSNSYCF